jgi:hypothetical protein
MATQVEDPEIIIVKLKIQMHTNKDTVDVLTADKIVINNKINGKFPFLCTNYQYSKDLLQYKSLEERVNLFFNYTKLMNYVIASKLKKDPSVTDQSEIIQKNIVIMLNAIFPISFPIKDQVSVMYQPSNMDLMNVVKQLTTPNEYAYLNIGKPCTVIQIIWLNTITTNPIYYQLYRKIRKYYKMIFNFINKNINSITANEYEIAIEATDDDEYDSEKIKKIKDILTKQFEFLKNRKEKKEISYPTKEEFILYYLIANLKDKEKNNFNEIYVQQYISSSSNRSTPQYRYVNNDEINKKKFLESLKESKEVDIDFYEQYIKDINSYLSPYRESTNPLIFDSLNNTNGDYTNFIDLIKQKDDEITYSGIDKIKEKDEKDLYEIQIGVGLVGGKITQSNYSFLCKFNSYRLGNMMNYLIKNTTTSTANKSSSLKLPTKENKENVRLYSYIDLENVNDTTEYIGVINSDINQNKTNVAPVNNTGYNYRVGGYKTRRKKNKRRTYVKGILRKNKPATIRPMPIY